MSPAPALIDLGADQVSLPTPQSVRTAAKAALDAGRTHYTDRPGVGPLREAVALKLSEVNGIHVNPADEVLITCGAQEGLFLTLRVLLTSHSEVIVPAPARPEDLELVRLAGAAARVAPCGDDLELSVDDVEALITDDTTAILLRSPTPAGLVVSERDLQQLGQLAVEHDLWVIAVESDEALVAPGVAHHSIASVAGLAPRTVTINDFGGIGLDAWRVGYLAAQRDVLALIRGLKQELSICSPAISQYAALAVMDQLGGYLAAVRDRLDTRRTTLVTALSERGLYHDDPQAGQHVLVSCGSTHPVQAVQRAHGLGVVVRDGTVIGAPGWLRLTLDQDGETLVAAVDRLAGALTPRDTEMNR